MLLINGGSFFSGGGVPMPWFKIALSGKPLVNMARFGSSNERIFRTSLAFILQKKPEIAVIEWTAPERQEIINHRTYIQVGYPPHNTILNGKYKFYPIQPTGLTEDGDREMVTRWADKCNEPIQDVTRSLQYVYSLRIILENMNIPYLFYFWRSEQFKAINYANVSEISHWDRFKKANVTKPSRSVSKERWLELTPELNKLDTTQFLREAGVEFDHRGLPDSKGHALFAEKFKVDLANVRY